MNMPVSSGAGDMILPEADLPYAWHTIDEDPTVQRSQTHDSFEKLESPRKKRRHERYASL